MPRKKRTVKISEDDTPTDPLPDGNLGMGAYNSDMPPTIEDLGPDGEVPECEPPPVTASDFDYVLTDLGDLLDKAGASVKVGEKDPGWPMYCAWMHFKKLERYIKKAKK